MLELLMIASLLFSFWVIGQSLLLFAHRRDLRWLSFPLGLCVTVIVHNFLYFGLDCRTQFIQKVLLVLTLLGVLYLYMGLSTKYTYGH